MVVHHLQICVSLHAERNLIDILSGLFMLDYLLCVRNLLQFRKICSTFTRVHLNVVFMYPLHYILEGNIVLFLHIFLTAVVTFPV